MYQYEVGYVNGTNIPQMCFFRYENVAKSLPSNMCTNLFSKKAYIHMKLSLLEIVPNGEPK